MKGWVNIIESCNNPGFPYGTSSFSCMRGDPQTVPYKATEFKPLYLVQFLDLMVLMLG